MQERGDRFFSTPYRAWRRSLAFVDCDIRDSTSWWHCKRARWRRPSLAVPKLAEIAKALQCCHPKRSASHHSQSTAIVEVHHSRHGACPQSADAESCLTLAFCPAQARVKAIAEIVGALVAGIKQGSDVDLNDVKREVQRCLSRYCAKPKFAVIGLAAASSMSIARRHH